MKGRDKRETALLPFVALLFEALLTAQLLLAELRLLVQLFLVGYDGLVQYRFLSNDPSVNRFLDLRADVHADQLFVVRTGVDPVAQKDVDQVLIRIGPGQGSRETAVPEAVV